uniref:Uncharacterized protein n=1 Tax=Setaria italica TaxID=4555 RepID=K3ZYK0_SETIT
MKLLPTRSAHSCHLRDNNICKDQSIFEIPQHMYCALHFHFQMIYNTKLDQPLSLHTTFSSDRLHAKPPSPMVQLPQYASPAKSS